MRISTRREFFAAAAAAGAFLAPDRTRAAGSQKFAGIFSIMQTPFTDSNALDTATLADEVRFLDRIGAQGMVWPQLASEYASLSYDERIAGAEAILRANHTLNPQTRPKVVIGVQAADIDAAVKYAKHADKSGADAIIAIPLDGGKAEESKQMEYYAAIGAASTRPLIVQAIGDMSVEFILRMAAKIPTMRYVKDEAGVTLPRLTEYRKRGSTLDGIFTGKHGPTFVDELARGAVGNMPASGFADLYVATWQAWNAGKRDEALDAFARTLLLISDAQAYGVAGQKYILQLRGVFKNAKCRNLPATVVFDDEAKEAIRRTVTHAQRWFRSVG